MNNNAVKIVVPHSVVSTPVPGSVFPYLQGLVQKGTGFLQILLSCSGTSWLALAISSDTRMLSSGNHIVPTKLF